MRSRLSATSAVAAVLLASVLSCSTMREQAAPAAPEEPGRVAQAAPVPAATPAELPTSVLEGVYTEVQAGRGSASYAEACAECHGEDLRGGEMAPGLTGVAFSFRWRGESVGAVYTSVRTTMPPEEPGTLSAEETADVIAYLLHRNGYPAGAVELPSDAAALEGVAIERLAR